MKPGSRRLSLAALAFALVHLGVQPARGQDYADYELRFDATWSAQTHPTDFPPNPHFSPLVGGLHDAGVVFWEPGGLASPGIEAMAETGSTSTLAAEVDQAIAAGHADVVLLGGGIPTSPGSVTIEFRATPDHPLLTLVSMVAPSPDWFVGVEGYELHDGESWVESDQIVLYAWDAGTDHGTTYTSPNADADPQDPISPLGAPLTPDEPMGTFTITLLPEPAPGAGIAAALLLTAVSHRRRASPSRHRRGQHA